MATKPTAPAQRPRKSKPRDRSEIDARYEATRVRTGERITLRLTPAEVDRLREVAQDSETIGLTIRRLVGQKLFASHPKK
jgi:hypothetical protein